MHKIKVGKQHLVARWFRVGMNLSWKHWKHYYSRFVMTITSNSTHVLGIKTHWWEAHYSCRSRSPIFECDRFLLVSWWHSQWRCECNKGQVWLEEIQRNAYLSLLLGAYCWKFILREVQYEYVRLLTPIMNTYSSNLNLDLFIGDILNEIDCWSSVNNDDCNHHSSNPIKVLVQSCIPKRKRGLWFASRNKTSAMISIRIDISALANKSQKA